METLIPEKCNQVYNGEINYNLEEAADRMASEQKYSNQDLAEIFERIAALLEIKGEVVFKIRAYQRAAESLRAMGEDVNRVAADGRLDEIPGVGKAIAEKISELLETGRLEFLERLEAEVPPGLLEVVRVPDLGPKKAALFWKELGITDLEGLRAAAQEGKLKGLPGMGAKSEARVIAGIEALSRRSDRMSLELARSHAARWLEWVKAQPGVLRAETAGSLRRWRETIGDLDIVAACEDGPALLDSFVNHPDVARVEGQGDNKASVELKNGVRIQLWAAPPARYGSLLLYATGSKSHNVRLRELALKKKLSLSDRGLLTEDDQLLEFDEEATLYAHLGLPWIPPEMREDRGEIEAGLKKKLPQLVALDDLKAELHSHSTWSDGVVTIAEMARAAEKRGYTTLAITDHTPAMGITGGPKAEQIPAQRAEVEQVRAEMGDQFLLLHGIEVDIMGDGSLAYPDEVLAALDIVIASLHMSLRQPREVVTARLIGAIRNPHVDAIAHPSGRLLPDREGADLDWDAVLEAAREHGVALEINASPSRLDINDVYARRAVELGIPLMINTDAHAPNNLDLAIYGVAVAKRAWAGPDAIINTWEPLRIRNWLEKRGK
jgi:DNA polymerase (family X)